MRRLEVLHVEEEWTKRWKVEDGVAEEVVTV